MSYRVNPAALTMFEMHFMSLSLVKTVLSVDSGEQQYTYIPYKLNIMKHKNNIFLGYFVVKFISNSTAGKRKLIVFTNLVPLVTRLSIHCIYTIYLVCLVECILLKIKILVDQMTSPHT